MCGDSVRMQQAKFKLEGRLRARLGVAAAGLLGALVLTACGSAPLKRAAAARPAQPLSHIDLPMPSEANAAALIMAAEFALQHDDAKVAAENYAQAAMISRDPKVAQRAVELNLAIRNATGMPTLIARWQVLGADAGALAGARAQLAMLQGNRDEARRQFTIQLSSGSVDDWRAFGHAMAGARDVALAGVLLESLAPASKLPPDEKLWVAFSQLGEKLGRHAYAQKLAQAAAARFGGTLSTLWAAQLKTATGDRAGAREVVAHGLMAHPDDTTLRLAYAALLDDGGDRAGAERVLANGPQDAQTWTARVAYAARANDTALLGKLYAQFKRAPAQSRQDSGFLLGQLAELLGKDSEALRWYGEVADDDEHAFDAQARSAVLLDKQGHHAQARQLAQRLQQDYADDQDSLRRAYQLEAELYAKNGNDKSAVGAYTRGLQAMPDDTELLYGRALSEAGAGDNAAAIADLRHVLVLKPDDVDAMNALGYTLADSNQHLDEAERLLRKALVARPDAPAIIDSWGWLQYRLGHLEDAEKTLRRAWDKGKDADIGLHLSEVLWKRGDIGGAKVVFAQVRKLDPDNKDLRALLERLQP